MLPSPTLAIHIYLTSWKMFLNPYWVPEKKERAA
jgi:hypothetical protein